MTKQEEKDLIRAHFKALRDEAGENSYIWDIFGPDTMANIERAIDSDLTFSFSELQEEKERRNKENLDLLAEKNRLIKDTDVARSAFLSMKSQLEKVRQTIADLYVSGLNF